MAEERAMPFGLPVKEGRERTSAQDWALISDFISGRTWAVSEPALETDKEDPLLSDELPFGAFMLGFDFHLTEQGPRLIEINTNAGGLATVFSFAHNDLHKRHIETRFLAALVSENREARKFGILEDVFDGNEPLPQHVAIVDDNVEEQIMYSEMKVFADVINGHPGGAATVCSPEDLVYDEDRRLLVLADKNAPHADIPVDFVYNRMTDFRMTHEAHAHIRRAAVEKRVILTPHPATYVRVADKRNLSKIKHEVVPSSHLLSDKTLDEWVKVRKKFVFKPADSHGAKGVYRGDKLSGAKLKKLPPDTIVQEYCPPSVSEDGSKMDLRVYTSGTFLLGLATRHFTGQVMEMRSAGSGFREALPEEVCCFPVLVDKALVEAWMEFNSPEGRVTSDDPDSERAVQAATEALQSQCCVPGKSDC